ncbi:hypothetical protein [Paenibacillus solanacearum]|uniref:hypothetical protein n=1 Tax=Paenibacillus solanacearum TaxID=2048548 RepID=UPI001C404366|nr:hypothetical protein [Paenibacillus solanacearum]
MLWGITSGCLFKFDPQTCRTLRSIRLYPYEWGSIYLKPHGLHFHQDGYLYGTAVDNVFRLDPQTWEYETLAARTSLFAQDGAGNVYMTKERQIVCRYEPQPEDAGKMTTAELNG